jgi:hypothetical protein
MVTARQPSPYAPRTGTSALAKPLRRTMPVPETIPISRPMPKSRRREYQAWMTLLIMASLLFLALGVFSLYGRICQTREINRRSSLNALLKQEKHRQEELTLKKTQIETDSRIAEEAAKRHMVRPTDKDAVTVP